MVYHTYNSFVHTSLLISVHFNESLVWFEVCSFCYTTLDAHRDSSQISCGCSV